VKTFTCLNVVYHSFSGPGSPAVAVNITRCGKAVAVGPYETLAKQNRQ